MLPKHGSQICGGENLATVRAAPDEVTQTLVLGVVVSQRAFSRWTFADHRCALFHQSQDGLEGVCAHPVAGTAEVKKSVAGGARLQFAPLNVQNRPERIRADVIVVVVSRNVAVASITEKGGDGCFLADELGDIDSWPAKRKKVRASGQIVHPRLGNGSPGFVAGEGLAERGRQGDPGRWYLGGLVRGSMDAEACHSE